jgi:hypothetical protein
MKTIRRLIFLLPVAVACLMAAAPQSAQAQPSRRASAEISEFRVDLSDRLVPGGDIGFTVEGTPRGQASVRLSGIDKNIVLREESLGVYEGSYTLSRKDRLGATPTARATLRVRNTQAVTTQALVAAPPVATPAPTAPTAPTALVIERFSVTPIARIEPGAELQFASAGTPGAKASFNIEGVVQGVPMREVRPGRYEGAYTIRRNDNFPAALKIIGILEANGQVMRSQLNQTLLVDAKPPTIQNLAPQNNETVAGSPVSVSATFDDRGGVGVDPKTVKLMIGGQDMTRNASITAQFLTWRGDLRPGVYPVEVLAADVAGNAVRQNWTFIVAGTQAPVVAASLPLQITSHANNAQVGGGAIEVRGRTVPDARLDVQVQAVASLAGYFGINQQLMNQTLSSDVNGNFVFGFQPQVPLPGARYEVTITASKGDLKKETKLVLFQQK